MFPKLERQCKISASSNLEAPWYDKINLVEAAQLKNKADLAIDRLDEDKDLVLDTVQHLRNQRLLMVQTYAQLAFCYEALLARLGG